MTDLMNDELTPPDEAEDLMDEAKVAAATPPEPVPDSDDLPDDVPDGLVDDEEN